MCKPTRKFYLEPGQVTINVSRPERLNHEMWLYNANSIAWFMKKWHNTRALFKKLKELWKWMTAVGPRKVLNRSENRARSCACDSLAQCCKPWLNIRFVTKIINWNHLDIFIVFDTKFQVIKISILISSHIKQIWADSGYIFRHNITTYYSLSIYAIKI